MSIWHIKSKRKPSGKRVNRLRKKRRTDRGSVFLETKIGKRKTKEKRARSGIKKIKILTIDEVNVADTKTKTVKKTKILSVEKNPANPHYVRRNVITKGAVIKTEIGMAVVKSRPGQHGIINAVKIEEKK